MKKVSKQVPTHVDITKFEKYLAEGYHAFYAGNVSNPHWHTTMNHKEWQRGFNIAYFENLQRISA